MRKNKPNKKYQSKNHSKFTLTYHLIFVCKYRKKLLIRYGEYIKQIMFDISKKYDFEILEIKQCLGYIQVMQDAITYQYSIGKIKLELSKTQHVAYKGRTKYYQLAMDILQGK